MDELSRTISIPAPTDSKDSSPPVVRCETTADFLAVLPLLTGFTDDNSLFIVLFQGKTGARALRMDLPNSQSPAEIRALVNNVIHLLEQAGAGAEGPALVISTGLRFDETVGPPWARLAHQLKRGFHRKGWYLRDLAVLAADGWCGLLPGSPGIPRPLSEVLESPFARTLEANHGKRTSSLDSVGELGDADPLRSTKLEQDLQSKATDLSAANEEVSLSSIHRVSLLAETCFQNSAKHLQTQSVLPTGRAFANSTEDLACLIRHAHSRTHWLMIVLTALTRPGFVAEVSRETGLERLSKIEVGGEKSPEARLESWSIYHLLQALAFELPERIRLKAVINVCNDAISHAPAHQTPPIYAMLVWCWWLLGLQSVAARLLDQGLKIAPNYDLLVMMRSLIEAPPAAHLEGLKKQFRSGDHAGY